MYTAIIPPEVKEQYMYAIKKAKEDRGRYLNWIKDEIEIAIGLINKYDKLYVLGGMGARLIKATPTFYNQFLATYNNPDNENIEEDLIEDDDESEILLEYAMNIAAASANVNKDVIPTLPQIQEIYDQLSRIKINMNFWELSADTPVDGNDNDHWLRTNIMLDGINVRGTGYQLHIQKVYSEIFAPHNGFLEKIYGFNAIDLYDTILKLDLLVYSKVGNIFGSMQTHKRFVEWSDQIDQEDMIKIMQETGKHFMQLFAEANVDLDYDIETGKIIAHHIDNVFSFKKIFRIIPNSAKEKIIFNLLSHQFDENRIFFQPPKFKAFPLNDTIIKLKPLVFEDGIYYHFSMSLAFRNIFRITEELIKKADAAYFENMYKGNSHAITRDNYIEHKTKQIFENLLPSASFYHSLDYTVTENNMVKKTELDILGISNTAVYIIEVKAGELNLKHRRGAIKGLKDRLSETISEGSYQCHRALKYIQDNTNPTFDYVENGRLQQLIIDKLKIEKYYKISVTLEHFAAISANLKYLINAGILSSDFKWTWIVSLYDLMIFSELIETELDLQEYLEYRIDLYERNDIEFTDEIDILGFFLEGHFPLPPEKDDQMIHMTGFSGDIDSYYTNLTTGMPNTVKPKRKRPTQ